MNSINATSLRQPRRRSAGVPATMAIDAPYTPYRHAVSRRRAVPGSEDYGWPEWVVPATVMGVMVSITLYHHQALFAVLGFGG